MAFEINMCSCCGEYRQSKDSFKNIFQFNEKTQATTSKMSEFLFPTSDKYFIADKKINVLAMRRFTGDELHIEF